MSVEEISEGIRSMKIRGAGKIARAGAQAMKEYAQGYSGKDVDEFRLGVMKTRKYLLSTRPTAVSLRNAVTAAIKNMGQGKTVAETKEIIITSADEFIKNSEKAVEIIGKIASKRIKDGYSVLTHCNSSAALAGIIHAHNEGKKIHAFCTESRPWQQGFLTAKALAAAGVPVTLIVDSAVRYYIDDIDAVFVGADTICSNGAVINKIGTSQIALCAHEARTPFHVCGETYKFSQQTLSGELVEIEERDVSEIANPKDFPGVKFANPVFDATRPEYIDGIITEIGLIPPHAAFDVIVKQFGYATFSEEEDELVAQNK